jgi:hypothetical protein
VTWLKVDDKLTTHPKWVGLTLEAKSLWFHAAVWCAAHNNDGELPAEAMPLIVFSASVPASRMDAASGHLVKARLWKRLPKGRGFEILNWLDYQPSKQQVQEKAEADELAAEMKRIHDWLHKKGPGKRVKRIIDARDGLWCRYCLSETVITPGDRRGPHRRTYDLIDPSSRWDMEARALPDEELHRIAQLWAVACGWCNAIKNKRTPDEADMVLLDPPSVSRCNLLPRSAANRSGTVRDLGSGLSGSVPVGAPQAATGHRRSSLTEGAPPHSDDDHFPGEDER